MFRPRIRTLLLLLILLIVAWSGTSYWMEYRENAARKARETLAPPLGAQCTVVFSSQDLAPETLPQPPADQRDTANRISGRFAAHNDQWIVLQAENESLEEPRRFWIPRHRVLMIEVTE